MTSFDIVLPNARENLRRNTKAAFVLGAKAVASVISFASKKTASVVEKYPRAVAFGGAVAAFSGLVSAANEVGKFGVTASQAMSTKLYEAIVGADQATGAPDVYNSSTPGLISLGILAAGVAISSVGFRSHANKSVTEVADEATREIGPSEVREVATVMSLAGVERVYDCTYETWHANTFSQPYELTRGERFDAWAENKWHKFQAWRQTIREVHAEQTRPDQPYNPFPQTTNYIGEPLLPG